MRKNRGMDADTGLANGDRCTSGEKSGPWHCIAQARRALSGIVAAVSMMCLLFVAMPAQAQYATGGSGLYRSNIIWFSWGTPPSSIPQAGQTVSNNYTVAGEPLVVTCSLSNISSPAADPDLIVYSPGTFFADGLDNLYNIGGIGTANTLDDGLEQRTAGSTVTFSFSCSATLNGQPYSLAGLVFADAETSTIGESIQVTIPAGSTYRMIERYRSGCTLRYQIIANAAGTTYRTNSPDTFCTTGSGPMGIGFIDGATSGLVSIGGATGETAIALGVMLDGADHGDAPVTYGDAAHLLQNTWNGGTIANGATQDVFAAGFALASREQPALRLGNSVDAETANQPSATGNGDDAAGSDDEDGMIPGSVSLLPGATTAQITLNAVNATPNPATLAGWVDFNNNGTFEPAERTEVTIPPNTNTATPFTLSWSGLTPIPLSFSSFARFRIATNPIDVALPTGLAADGEVEDYRVPTVPAFATCDTRAFLFQSTPTDIFSIDLVTGGSTQVGTDVSPVNINAVGYNPLDNYIYGMDSAATGTGLIRVGSDFTVQTLGFPTGLPTTVGFNLGEFDNNGHYWVNSGATGNVYEVDMRPGSATYFQVVSSRAINAIAGFSGGADWAYNPVDGFLYRTPTNATTGRLHLFRYDRASGVQTNLGAIAGIAADATVATGANYSDAAGFVYGSDNTSGRIFRVNTTTIAGSVLSTGPLSGTNDGARCFNAQVPIDFGDAPDTYGTSLGANGARHSIPGYNAAAKTAPLMLGNRISAEADGQPSADASLDTFDDGLVPGSVVLTAGSTTASATLSVVNAKATAATLSGWVDFNGNGTFEPSERAQVTVPANTTSAMPFTLSWTGLAPIPSGFSSPARFRIATTAAQVANAVGAAADGEVEDYVVPITLPPVDCSTNPSIFNTAYNSATGGVLPPGSRDRNWDAGLGTPSGGPTSVTNWIDAYVTGNAAPGAWANSPFGNADWISFFPNANQGTSNVDEYHRYRFNLDPAVVPSSFSLGIDFYADNSVWEVYVNGVPQSGLTSGLPQSPTNPYFYTGFIAGNQAHIQLNHSWQTGTNEIVVQVKSGPGFVGFMGQVTSTGLCPAQVGVIKTADPPGALTPNGTVTYTVTVTNTGLVPAVNTLVTDPLPTGIVSGTWTCAAVSGASCPNATGSMPLNETIATFPGGGVVTYTITGIVAANPPASVINTVSATPTGYSQCFPDNSLPPCSSTVANPPVPIVSIAKTASETQAIPGGPLTYSLTVRNTGSMAADGTTISDPVPAGLSAVTWTCTASGSAVCPNANGSGAINETIATFPPGGQIIYTIDATVDANPPASITNTATTTPPGGGVCNDGSPPPCTGTVTLPSAPQISVIKTANPAGVLTPGGTVTYTIAVSNDGSSAAPSTLVRDAFPAGIDSATWTCAASNGAVCPNVNSGGAITPPADLLNETVLTFPPGGLITYTITATVSATPPANIVNTASVSPPGGVCLPSNSPPPCTSTVSNPSAPVVSVVKTADTALLIPGGTVTYTVVVTNTGSVAADGTLISDPIPAGLTTPFDWTCVGDGGAICANDAGSGAISESITTFPAAATITYTITATVVANPPAVVGNTASVVPPDGVCADGSAVPCTGSVVTPVAPQISVTKTANQTDFTPGGPLSWTVSASNLGSVSADGTVISDPLPSGVVSATWTCVASGGAVCAGPSGNGAVAEAIPIFPPGGVVTYTITATTAVPGPTSIANTVSVTPPGDGRCLPGNTLPPCTSGTITPSAPSVVIAKSVVDASGDNAADPGEQLTYTILLSNNGGSDATNYGVTDPLDANTSFVSASNGGTFAGGVVTWTGLTVPAGGTIGLTVVVTVADPLPSGVTAIGNLAYETGGPPPDCSVVPRPANCTEIPTAARIVIAKTAGTPAPTGNPNEYQLTYTATVTNQGGSAGSYNLDDTLTFNGATVTAISAPAFASSTGGIQDGTLGAFGPPTGGTIVMGEDLSTGGIETWTYTVTYTITDGDLASDCASALGGLRNEAALGGTAGGPPAETCTGAPSVSIVKTADAPVPTGNPNEFTLTYTVNVSNVGSVAGVYDLSDVLTFNGATVGAISAPAYSSSTGDTQDGALGTLAPPDGGVIVTGESITAGGAETWTYAVTYTVTDDVIAQDCADPNGGLRNSAALGGSLTGQSTTCTGAAAVVIGKSVSGPTATGNPNEYTLSYLVTVQNNGTVTGTYDLHDSFTFPGVSGVVVSAVTHGGADPLSTALGTLLPSGGTIVTDETIAAGANETYAYTVTFTVDDAATVGDCASGGGLVNNASLGGSSTGQVGTCSGVPSLVITKTASVPVQVSAPNQYAIDYVVTVANNGGAGGVYDLDDSFAYAGASVDSVSAIAHGGADPLATTLGTLTTSGGNIVTGETVAAGSSETYAYTVTFTLTDPATANDCANPNGGLRNAATLGGSATGDADTCSTIAIVAITKALTGESGTVPGVAEPGETLTYTITLANNGSSDAINYEATDALDPNVTFVSASNGGTLAGGLVNWSGLTVPAGGSLPLTVVVTVDDPIPPGVDRIGNVAYPTGTLPPDCSGTPTPPSCVITPTPGVVSIVKAVTDANGNNLAEPGETLTYTITLTNTTGGDATNYGVTDPLDANVVFVSASNGGTFAGGVVTWTGLTIPAGGTLPLTVVVTVADPLPPGVTQIGNLAYETGGTPPDCTAIPLPPNCTVIVTPAPGAVTIAKSVVDANGNALAEPGEQLTYTIALVNSGGTDIVDYGVTDPLDANVVFVSASNGGSFAAGAVTWSRLTVPADSTLSLTVVVTVANPLPPGVTQISNLAYETGGTPPNCSTLPLPPNCTIIVTPTPGAVTIAKSVADASGNGLAEPGEALTYTITLVNSGGVDIADYGVTDPLDTNVVFVSASNGGVFAGGVVSWSSLIVPANSSVVLTVVVTVANPLPPGVTQIGNLAYETGGPPPDCSTIPTPPNCTQIPVVTTEPPPQLTVTKTANVVSAEPGGTVIYTIAVTNSGTVTATNVVISDPMPAGMSSFAWTCAAANGATCASASGNGAINETIPSLPPGGRLVYTVTATLSMNPPANVTNIVSVSPSGNTVCLPAGTPAPCDAQVPITVIVGGPGPEPIPAPIDSRWMLVLMGVSLVLAATMRRKA